MGALYWSLRNDTVDAWSERPIAEWVAAVARAWPEAEPIAAGLEKDDLRHGTYRDVWMDPPHQGRLGAIGDAAHGTSPQLGQGVTQALRDAAELTAALRLSGNVEQRLGIYWHGRKARVRYYRLASRWLTAVFQSRIPGFGAIRDTLAGPVGGIPHIPRQSLLTTLGVTTGLWTDDLDRIDADPDSFVRAQPIDAETL